MRACGCPPSRSTAAPSSSRAPAAATSSGSTRSSSSSRRSSTPRSRSPTAASRVIAAGLDQDFRRQPFGPMPELLARAEFVDKLQAVCHRCGGPATTTQRLVDGRPGALLGRDDRRRRARLVRSALPRLPQRWSGCGHVAGSLTGHPYSKRPPSRPCEALIIAPSDALGRTTLRPLPEPPESARGAAARLRRRLHPAISDRAASTTGRGEETASWLFLVLCEGATCWAAPAQKPSGGLSGSLAPAGCRASGRSGRRGR